MEIPTKVAASGECVKPDPYSVLDSCYVWIERHFSWARHPGLSALLVVAMSLAVAFPPVRTPANWGPEWGEQAIDWQLHHPLSAIPAERFAKPGLDSQGMVDHLRKRTYRITLPLIAYCLGLGLRGTEILSALSSIAFVVVVLFYFRRLFPEHPVTALLLGISTGCSFLGQCGAYFYFFFDGVGYLLLALAAYVGNPILISVFLLAGGLSDERVILASPLIYLLHSGFHPADSDLKLLVRPNRRQCGIIAGIILFIVARLWLGIHIGRQFDSSMVGLASVGYNLTRLPLALALVFKGATFVMAAGFLCLLKWPSTKVALLLLICIFPGIAANLFIWDFCRSLGYVFPVVLFCTKVLLQSLSSRSMRRLAVCGALISACLPTYYLWESTLRALSPVFDLRAF